MDLTELLDQKRFTRVLRANIPEPKMRTLPTHSGIDGIRTPPGWHPEEEPYNSRIQALRDGLTPAERAHCAQGNEPLKPNSEEEKLFKRMQKFGTVADIPPQSPSAPLNDADFLADEKLKARMQKFGTGPIQVDNSSEMSADRVSARMAKFGTS
ncbi:SAP domain-containing ribonucleoprotein-like protein [Perkinsela sp. CCAP 1560/4]|nr:SAP domain-containing ribonucleoprotein-like protein [Perkinsela sp. CCAP 1560/4]|eukprot:KNH05457.1 SAP domain-containing ribonucleoprotein-like protein [Perkinsela sp. CCAP 1560/4]